MTDKIDSNSTGARIAYETSIGVLPVTPIWYPLEPNAYTDFGSTISTKPRRPINPSRQRKKGFVTDLDAKAGFNQDLTQTNSTRHLQGVFFAALREKATTAPMNGTATALTAVTAATGYAAASGLGIFAANNLIKASGFSQTGNNGFKVVSTASATSVQTTPAPIDEASPSAGSKLEKVGQQFAAGDINFTLNGNLSRMTSTANALAVLGLIPGEWVYVGGDTVGTTPTTQKGWARASVITAGYIEFDKTDWIPGAETLAGKTVQVFIGSLLRTEEDPALQVRYSATIERTLGNNGTGNQAEYVKGSCFNTLNLNIPQSDKITLDFGFVSIDTFYRTGAQGLMTGIRPTELSTDAFNTSSDFSRIKMSIVDTTNSNVAPLFAYLMDFTLNLSNSITPTKALGVLGAFDTSSGMFTADGSITAYFTDPASAAAVRNNTDVTIDIVMAKNNAAMVWDIPLLTLGNGVITVEIDQPIKIPLNIEAAQSRFNHTMVYQNFPYTPNAAQ